MNSAPYSPDLPTASAKPTVGVGVVVLRAGYLGLEVLLILRARPPRQGEWSIPGGKQEWGETLHETARRESWEETGVQVAELRLVDAVDALFRDECGSLIRHLTLIDYRADWVSGEARPGEDAAEARWVPIADLGRYALWDQTERVILAAAAMG